MCAFSMVASEMLNNLSAFQRFENLSDEDLSEDDRMLDEQEDFERKYNFRYEEPDSGFVSNSKPNMLIASLNM